MKYFNQYLNEIDSIDEIDISVHCDVEIFQWLINYVYAITDPTNKKLPKLTINNVISILISSDFLKMKSLVQLCLIYFQKHLLDITETSIDLQCVNTNLMLELTKLYTLEQILALEAKLLLIKSNKKQYISLKKIILRFYACKLNLLLSINQLNRCKNCNTIYFEKNTNDLLCYKSKLFINVHGKVQFKHSKDIEFNLSNYILKLRKLCSWKELFWKIYGLYHVIQCKICHISFTFNLYHGNCYYHLDKALFPKGENNGFYPCCNKIAYRFLSSNYVTHYKGCKTTSHIPTSDTKSSILDLYHQYYHKIIVQNQKDFNLYEELSNLNQIDTSLNRFYKNDDNISWFQFNNGSSNEMINEYNEDEYQDKHWYLKKDKQMEEDDNHDDDHIYTLKYTNKKHRKMNRITMRAITRTNMKYMKKKKRCFISYYKKII